MIWLLCCVVLTAVDNCRSLVPNVGSTHYRDGGTRGGRDRFKWEDVKTDTYRENYIGHSLKAPVGKW